MPGEIITAASILARSQAGAWLADKLLAPSFEALGEQFRAYAGARLSKIFARAERKIENSQVTSLPPGFAMQLIQKASFSEDDEIITELWAGLIADAAEEYSSKHNIFVDILSQIGPDEARFLDRIYRPDVDYELIEREDMGVRSDLFEKMRRSVDWGGHPSHADAEQLVDFLLTNNFGWPMVPSSAESYWSVEQKSGKTGTIKRVINHPDSFVSNALIRQRLIEYFDLDFHPGWASPSLSGFLITSLGIEFLNSCRKQDLPGKI